MNRKKFYCCVTQSKKFLVYFLIILLVFFDNPIFAQTHKNIVIQNKDLKITLDSAKPSIIQYELKSNNGILLGNSVQSQPSISFYEGENPVYRLRTKINYTAFANSKSTVTYHVNIMYESKPAIELDLIYSLRDNNLNISFTNVKEYKNFYLFSVNLPGLVSVKSDGGKLVIPANSGRLINVATASLKSYEYQIDWLNPLLAAMAYNSRAIAVVDTRSIENSTGISVFDRNQEKFGSVSTKLIYRLKEYDLPEFGTVISANDSKYFLKVQDSSEISISIIGDYDKDGKIDWIDGAKLLRDKVKATPSDFYKNKTFVRTFLARKGGNSENLTFNQVLARIKEFAEQTDSAGYVMYLLGWQYKGHDSGYPSIDSVNKELGGYDDMIKLIEEAKKYNVTVTFYDNYDDSYSTHPRWDSDVICRDPLGNLMKGGAWDGEQSYLISSYKYALKSGLDRVRRTLKKYPVIKNAYFIDVLSGGYNGGRKYDFNPSSPAGAIKNFEGKKMIINEFKKQGIDVATEDFSGYFVGYAGTFGDIIAFDDVYFSDEEQIPLIPFIYHGKTSFGMKTSSSSEYVETFLYGQRAQKFTNLRLIYSPADYILDALPKQVLYGKSMNSYQKNGSDEKVTYDDGTVIKVNMKADTYEVTLADGEIIAHNYTSFVPVSKNIYFACTKKGGDWVFPLPATWEEKSKIRIYNMTNASNATKIRFDIKNKQLKFNALANVPYKITYE